MPIHRLNHAVLYVSDLDRSVSFYEGVLGFRQVMGFPGAAFLQAPGSNNDHDLGLFQVPGAGPSLAGRQTVGLYHLAWEVDTLRSLEEVSQALLAENALVGATDHGTTKALYGRDPDGIEFEVCWLVPAEHLDSAAIDAKSKMRRLDLAEEIQRYGAETLGGVGVSISGLIPSR
ncbi:MAG: VOC family protein [Acidimicrobiia bacterium]